MAKIHINFQNHIGQIKPMHSVNNGPIVPQAHSFGNFEDYAAAGFPMARTHDASFSPAYGGSHTVDIIAIFPDFDDTLGDLICVFIFAVLPKNPRKILSAISIDYVIGR